MTMAKSTPDRWPDPPFGFTPPSTTMRTVSSVYEAP